MKWRDFLIPKFLKKYRKVLKEEGFKALIKKHGWKVFGIIFTYYLIRDSILYILIPYLIARGFLG